MEGLGRLPRQLVNAMTVKPSIFVEIREGQTGDVKLERIKKKLAEGKARDFKIHEDGSIRYKGRWCVPQKCTDLKRMILEEGHETSYSVHPGGDKLYKDLKKVYWWPRMKREVAEFVEKCPTCQKVKAERKKPLGLVKPLEVPRWKWDSI